MTLTTILPTLRRTLPDPLSIDAWPEHTHATTTDVVVAGISMLRLVELCETPCAHSANAVIPGTRGRPSPVDDSSVVIVRVTGVLVDQRIALVDGCLERVPARWSEARLLGRVSTAHDRPFTMLSGESSSNGASQPAVADLPDDLREGDLIAIPCAGIVTLHELRAHAEAIRDAEPAWWGRLE